MIWRRVVALLVFSWSFLLPAGWAEKRRGVIVALGAWAVSTGLAIWVGWRIGPEIFSEESFVDLRLILPFSLIMLLSSVPAGSVLQVKNSQSLFTLPGVRHGCFIFYFLGFLGYVTWAYLTLGGFLVGRYGTITFGYLSHPVTQTLFFILLLISIQCLHSSRPLISFCLYSTFIIGVFEAPRIGFLENDQVKLLVGLSFIATPIVFLLFDGRRTAHSISLDGHRIVIDRSSYLKDRVTGDKISSQQQPNRVEEVIANGCRSIIDRYEGKFLEDFRSLGLIGYLLMRETLLHIAIMALILLLFGVIGIFSGTSFRGDGVGLIAFQSFGFALILMKMYPSSPLIMASRYSYRRGLILNPFLQSIISGVLVTLLVCIVEPQLTTSFLIILPWCCTAILNTQLFGDKIHGSIFGKRKEHYFIFLIYIWLPSENSIEVFINREYSPTSLIIPAIILLVTAIRVKLRASAINRGDLDFESSSVNRSIALFIP